MKRILRACNGTIGLVVVGLLLAGCGASSTAHVALKSSHQQIANLEGAVNLLERDSAALRSDVLSLNDNLHTEVTDVATATASIRTAQVMASGSASTTPAAVCDSVSTARADVENIADDEQFLAGFVSGLRKTISSVAAEASDLRVADVETRSAKSNSTPTITSNLAESKIQRALSNATSALRVARASADTGIRSVNSDLTTAIEAVNALASSTGCGTAISPPALLAPASN